MGAIIAEEFTFSNVQRAVGGIARYVASRKRKGVSVIVGRDPHFLGETLVSMAYSIRHNLPEKDGILAGLFCSEAVARRGKSLRQQLKDISNKVGSFYPKRENFRLTPGPRQSSLKS
jgi:phosphomannomutase